MEIAKSVYLIIIKILLASILVVGYWALGGSFLFLINFNIYTSFLSCLLYVTLGFLFFTIKSSKYSGLYGALEITLGLATFFVPFFLTSGISDKILIDSSTKYSTFYIAFYSGIYIQARGFENVYKNWKSNPSKYDWAFNKLFNYVKKIELQTIQQHDLIKRTQSKKRKWKQFSSISVLYIISIFISFLVFYTIVNTEHDLNNVYYIFSTSAQTIAALVGLVLAAYTFNHQFMWNARDSSEGTSEIIDETIQKYYTYIKLLSIATGFTLIADIFMLQLNATLNSSIKPALYILIGSLNVCVIITAFLIALHIIRPINIEDWAKNLFNERIRESENKSTLTINRGEFIDTFITLETIVRNFLNNLEPSSQHVVMAKMTRELYERGTVDEKTFGELIEIIKYRNLVIHGHIPMVEKDMYDKLLELTELMNTKLKLE
ncbi:hypothetical protein COK37_21010 [Bacillus thuringiensis]|uniref:hypothetical protein n=1 Tax=Bacillus cereus group TaxID=86661 RepID=UPI000BF5E966|nr:MULTISPECIES: hypothetical protein [Bacillus cereus group]PEV50752.1 hypothetical protein CN432_09095 [Bacillus thuringiensis]PFR65832.1 hypothetical protein COK37_21010 [Bacillus thuringiensis]PFT77431.1 hypothetical protein COK70_19785 [Bacillus thuringiensis]PFV87923.1 hypothetical protein COL06_15135 [Bacillus thuringiensis]PHC86970.1 hypothetical protein COF42_15975 [Bacillus wiedmannii]